MEPCSAPHRPAEKAALQPSAVSGKSASLHAREGREEGSYRDSSTASERASTLLKDADFRAKYPALAKALQETVGDAPSLPCTSETSLSCPALSRSPPGDEPSSASPPSPSRSSAASVSQSVASAPPASSEPDSSPDRPCPYEPTPRGSEPTPSPSREPSSFASQVDLCRPTALFACSPTVGFSPPSVPTTTHNFSPHPSPGPSRQHSAFVPDLPTAHHPCAPLRSGGAYGENGDTPQVATQPPRAACPEAAGEGRQTSPWQHGVEKGNGHTLLFPSAPLPASLHSPRKPGNPQRSGYSAVEAQAPASRYIPANMRCRKELTPPPGPSERADGTASEGEHEGHVGGQAAAGPLFAVPPGASPPHHFLNRLEDLQHQYAGIVGARNAVEYQYQLFRSLDRPPILLSPPPRPSFLPATPGPGAYARLPPQLPKPLQSLQRLYQQRQQAAKWAPSAMWPGGPGTALPGFATSGASVSRDGLVLPWQTTAPPPFFPGAMGPPGRGSAWSPDGRPAAGSEGAPAAPAAPAVAGPVCGARAVADWKGLGPVEKDKTVNPALVFAKETMDGVLQQLQSEAVSLKKGSREIGRKLLESKAKSEVEEWRTMGVDERLCELTVEQQAFIKEQMRAIDEAKENLQTMKSEADRLEHRTRDAFHRALYASGEDSEEVQARREQVKKMEELRQQLPPESAVDATVCGYVTQAGPDPLEKLDQLDLGHALEQLPAQKCRLAVASLLRQMGYRKASQPVPVRRNGYPAQYFSKFPELYPYPEYGSGLPLSQQAIQERRRELEEKGVAASALPPVHPEVPVPPPVASALLKEEQSLMEDQKQKQDEEEDWEEYFRTKREARDRALEEARACKAREEAMRAAEEAREAVELLARRQRLLEEETRCAERRARAERELAKAEEAKARALREAELRARLESTHAARGRDPDVPERAGDSLELNRRSREDSLDARGRRPSHDKVPGPKTGVSRTGSQRRQATLTVEAAETLADRMRQASLMKRRSVVSPKTRERDRDEEPEPSRAKERRERDDGRRGEGRASRSKVDRGESKLHAMPSLGVQRTLTMYKTPLSRTLSSSQPVERGSGADKRGGKASDAQRLSLDKVEPSFDDKRDLEKVQVPEQLLSAGLVVLPVETRRKADLTRSTLARRLPAQKCETFVHLQPPPEPQDAAAVYARYREIKELLASGQLGLKEKAQDVYDFAFACCKKVVREDPHSQQYANVLMEAVPYYPYQIDIQRAGVIAFLNIFEHCKYQEQLSVPLFDCLTTLMAIDESSLRGDIIAVMAAVIRPQVVINSDLVDLLLNYIEKATEPELCSYGIHVLLVARSPHKKEEQYALFVRLLGKWKFESTVPTRACLAIDAFAKRAQLEELAAHQRAKGKQEGSIQVSEGLAKLRRGISYSELTQLLDNPHPPAWMGRDANDVQQVVLVMDRHSQHRRLQGAACQALSSLCGVSLLHCEYVASEGLSRMYTATLNHKESQTIALSLCSVISLLATVPKCRALLQPKMVLLIKQCIARHRAVAEVVGAACGALAKLDAVFPVTNENMERLTWAIIVNNLKNSSDQPQVVIPTADLIQRMAAKVNELAEVRERLVELDAVEALVKSITGCSADLEACQVACRAVSRLVYRQPQGSRIYTDLVRLRVMTAFLFVLLKHHKNASFCRDVLCCIANCASYRPCAEAVMERGVNVICKAMDANIKDVEVVAQGCRCLGLIAEEASLKAAAESRAEAIISFAVEQFSSKAETRRLLSDFLWAIFRQHGVPPQLIERLWNPSEPFQTPRRASPRGSVRERRGDEMERLRSRSPTDPRALARVSSHRTLRSPSLSPLPSFRDVK
ncbi:conserved hypothetical protein [Neospora caninum Liverpool]|uniref:Uncharacterized protein n=1 Tax=Neospora caninum (strain Liverpool) TaxID=572307 RepID=F0VK42_NEOCL|nr:conserved hypothetical protein [Neospora caninum Liverpool]CBZ54443.1 conserved hypothetical protein [Neospora caninum Liverpool]CEL69153.1 TPA: hypothetical protein BN1204_048720 [Neospora caninum Liverpool]|eukprot:XP_003884473.1 conserved hypothetical protein [Neospora caninum Liverpool]